MSYPCHVCAGTMLPGVTYSFPREYDPTKPSCGKVYNYYQGTAYIGMSTGGSLSECGFCKGSGMVENRRMSIGPRRRNADRRSSARPEALQRWTSVDERLPVGIEKPLLLYGESELLIMGIWNGPDSVFLAWSDELEDWREIPLRITHWMVIPDAPSIPSPLGTNT